MTLVKIVKCQNDNLYERVLPIQTITGDLAQNLGMTDRPDVDGLVRDQAGRIVEVGQYPDRSAGLYMVQHEG
jgi:hypothetical protein